MFVEVLQSKAGKSISSFGQQVVHQSAHKRHRFEQSEDCLEVALSLHELEDFEGREEKNKQN